MLQPMYRMLLLVLLLVASGPASAFAAPSEAELAASSMATLNRGQYSQAIQAAGELCALYPQSAIGYHIQAVAHLRLYAYRDAVALAERTLACNVSFVAAYEVMALASAELRDWASVRRTCKTGLSYDSQNRAFLALLDRARDGEISDRRSGVVVTLISLLAVVGLVLALRRYRNATDGLTSVAVLSIGGMVSFCLYHLFYFFSPFIWSFNDNVAPEEVLPLSQAYIYEYDGIEGYVLLAIMLLATMIPVFLIEGVQRVRRSNARRGLIALCGITFVAYIGSVGMYPPLASSGVSFGFAALSTVCLVLIAATLHQLRGTSDWLGLATAAALLIPVCFVSSEAIRILDYSYVLSPALRLLQGASLSDVYLQYDLLMSLVAAGWMKAGLPLESVELIGQLSMYIFFLGTYWFGLRFFGDRRLASILIVCLVAVRVYANIHSPSAILQVTSLRLDWWLLLLVLANRYGVHHWAVGMAIGALMLLHRNFGLLYLAAYLCLLCVLLLHALRMSAKDGQALRSRLRDTFTKQAVELRMNIAIIAGFAVATYLLYGGVVADSAVVYQRMGLGMIAISHSSFYWLMPLVYAMLATLLWYSANRLPERYVRTAWFALFLAITSSVYFFGRSHENNIINLSSILLFGVFILFDVVSQRDSGDIEQQDNQRGYLGSAALQFRRHRGMVLALLFTIGVGITYGDKIAEKATQQINGLRQGQWRYPFENATVDVSSVNSLVRDPRKVYILEYQRDFLYYYYGGYPQTGYLNPCNAWLVRSDFVDFLNGLLTSGYDIVAPTTQLSRDVISRLSYTTIRERNGVYAFSRDTNVAMTEVRDGRRFQLVFPQPTNRTLLYKLVGMKSSDFSIDIRFSPSGTQVPNASIFSVISDDNQGVAFQTLGTNAGEYVLAFGNGREWRIAQTIRPEIDRVNRLVIRKKDESIVVMVNGDVVFSGPDPSGMRFETAKLTVGAPFDAQDVWRGAIHSVSVGYATDTNALID